MATTLLMSQVLPFEFRPMYEDPVGSGNLVASEVDAASVVVASADETVIRVIVQDTTNTLITGIVDSVMPSAEGAPPTRYTISADADLSSGVTTITGYGEVTVVADPARMATTFALTELAPVPKAPTPTPIR